MLRHSAMKAGRSGLDRRVLQARLQIVIDSLLATVVFNPLFAAICAAGLAFPGSPFGTVPIGRLAAAMAFQLLGSAAAWAIYRRYRTVMTDAVESVNHVLLAVQVLFSGMWGAFAFLCWDPGNAVNHVFIAMIMAVCGYAIVFVRAMHMPVLLVALGVQGGLFFLRMALGGDAASHIIAAILPLYFAYLLLMGRASQKRIDALIAARLGNEDMAAQLTRARDEALKKRYEAETANASKTAFLANMSHELRTPLNAILGFSDIIAGQAIGRGDIDRYSEYARDIHNSGTHLLSLINDLLDVAKIEAGRMEIDPRPIDARSVIEGAERLVAARAAERKQQVQLDVPRGLPLLMADERALKQMLLNLLSNAVKFTPVGGHIRVSCRAPQDGRVEICVADNGPGIAPEKLAHVFEPFSQIDNRYDREAGGTGLGLALVRGLAQLHGGRVWIESDEGRGTRAFIRLPAAAAEGAGRAAVFP